MFISVSQKLIVYFQSQCVYVIFIFSIIKFVQVLSHVIV